MKGMTIVEVEKIKVTVATEIATEKKNLGITGATLLSCEDAEHLPDRLKKHQISWWVQPFGGLQTYISDISNSVCMVYPGQSEREAIRPALQIDLKSSDFKVGDCFIFGGKVFEIISDSLAFCQGDIGIGFFDLTAKDKFANNYEQSDVKKYIDDWFAKVVAG